MNEVRTIAIMLYQNREQEGIEKVAELLPILQAMVQQMSKQQTESCGNFALIMMKELLENYQRQNVIGMADCLMEKVELFVQFVGSEMCIRDSKYIEKRYLKYEFV